MRRTRPSGDYFKAATPLIGNFIFAGIAGAIWCSQFICFKTGEPAMGKTAYVGWALLMACQILFSSLIGVFFIHEWKGTSGRTKSLLGIGLSLLILTTVVSGYGGYLGQQAAKGGSARGSGNAAAAGPRATGHAAGPGAIERFQLKTIRPSPCGGGLCFFNTIGGPSCRTPDLPDSATAAPPYLNGALLFPLRAASTSRDKSGGSWPDRPVRFKLAVLHPQRRGVHLVRMPAQARRLAGNGGAQRGCLGDRLAAPVEHRIDRMAGQRGQQRPEQRVFRPAGGQHDGHGGIG